MAKSKSKKFYLQIFNELVKTISESNIDRLTELSYVIDDTRDKEHSARIDCYNDDLNPIKSTNLVILACKYNKVNALDYLLDKDRKILHNLSIGVGRPTISPDDEDETCHNAFYYALRSDGVELLKTLINKWPGDYFAVHPEELDEILSKAYEELKLKNVPLSDDVGIFVESKLINLRFFSDTFRQTQSVKSDLNNIRERIEIVLQKIRSLKAEYLGLDVDEKFLFTVKFIAQNIHVLKQQLKSTYGRLPWEEVEFCLVSFISSQTKRQEINLFYQATLDKTKILNYLETFAKKLEDEKHVIERVNINKLAELPKLKRKKAVVDIVSNCPSFQELYDDYQQIRDVHSLEKISDYIHLALSVDPKTREGRLIITRVLQVIGEYLKNTLESPKLSNSTSDLLLITLPKTTRAAIIDLRNSLSHAHSLCKRTEIEENTDIKFFIGVQNDTTKVGHAITSILFNKKVRMIRVLLNRILDSKTFDEIKEIVQIFCNVEFEKTIKENQKLFEHEKLETLVKELHNSISDQCFDIKMNFDKIYDILHSEKNKSIYLKIDYLTGFATLKALTIGLNDRYDDNIVKGMQFRANEALKNIACPEIDTHKLKEIVELTQKIYSTTMLKINNDNKDEITRLVWQICFIAQFDSHDTKWIEKLSVKLNGCHPLNISTWKQTQTYDVTEETLNKQLSKKLSELKSTLNSNALGGQAMKTFTSYRSDTKLQAVVEMLVLDVMSILGISKNCLENNQLFLDGNTPVLTGKCLRNHLAHGNTLVDVLFSDSLMAVILNAKALTIENVIKSMKKIGKPVRDNPSKLVEKHDQGLVTVTNQTSMFVACEEGNMELFKSCLRKGADIYARSINSWTALHFASKGPSVKMVKLILGHNVDVNVKDINGQSPLHIAAAYGRKNIVEYFIKKVGLSVDEVERNGQTPLHITARNGHKEVVQFLLRNRASTFTRNAAGLSAVHYAIKNHHNETAKVLLEGDGNVDSNLTLGDFTPLHGAAENGNLEMVNFLLQKMANANAKNERNWTPLHAAARDGHLEIVTALVRKGAANIDAQVVNGCTPLFYAVEYGHESIAKFLIKHGANVNAGTTSESRMPLHIAAKDGHIEIVKALLENQADARVAAADGLTPLHLASKERHSQIVSALIEHGVDIDARSETNTTPLHYASGSGCKEAAEVLIKHGATVDAKDNPKHTPLHYAALNGHKKVVDCLLKHKANANAQDFKLNTPLHSAAANGSIDVIELLLKYKAKVDHRNAIGLIPLHIAALKGHRDVVVSLLINNSEVNTRAEHGLTPLIAAVLGRHVAVVNILLQNNAKVNDVGVSDSSPLHVAVESGSKKMVEVLIAKGANVNLKSQNITPLCLAIKHNLMEVVKLLLENGANPNGRNGEPLLDAVLIGSVDVVKMLLKHKARANIVYPQKNTLLHIAATRGHTCIVELLIKNEKGSISKLVNAVNSENVTPLFYAAQIGCEEVVEMLLANGSNVNAKNTEGETALHLAAAYGHRNVVKMLLENQANINEEGLEGRTPFELAVSRSHLEVVKLMLQYKDIDVNAVGKSGWPVLHIASQEYDLELVKFIVEAGADMNAKNALGSKAIHIAAREGHKDTLEFFLSKGFSVKEEGAGNQTLLHYAAMKGHMEIVKFLIEEGADVNAQDANGHFPIHLAALFKRKDIIEVLLRNGAAYNVLDNKLQNPSKFTSDKAILNLLASTEMLFAAVKCNSLPNVEKSIKAGAFVNAKNTETKAPLHYATWRGYARIVATLLQNKANPDLVDKNGFTSLHYAARFSHLKVVKLLLCNGATYNYLSISSKTPSDLAEDESITSLFKLVSESFEHVRSGNTQVINNLNGIECADTVKAIMSARSSEKRTLFVTAVHHAFPKVEQLTQILYDLSKRFSAL